jgi:hypothetical protein
VGLLVSLYPLDPTQETLSSVQLTYFNQLLNALIARLQLDAIDPSLIGLKFDGTTLPLPFPDLHWELAACWLLVDGTIPTSITLKDGSTLEYHAVLLRDPVLLQHWKKKLDYARTGFRLR